MSIFSAAVSAMLSGDTPSLACGAVFEFASGTKALWPGIGNLDATAFEGPIFSGIGGLGSVSDIEIGTSQQSSAITFELSGLDASVAAAAKNQGSEVKGRRAEVWFLFFSSNGSLLDARKRRTVIMDRMTSSIDAGSGQKLFKISLSAEPILARKNRAPFATLSDADQRAKHPGDTACEFMNALNASKTLIWN